MLFDSKIAKLVAGCLSYLARTFPSQDVYIEENPGLWVEVRTTDDPEVQIRIDAESYDVTYRVGMGDWLKLPFELKG